MIQAEHITKTFHGFKALDDMSLHVPKGTIYGLVGPKRCRQIHPDPAPNRHLPPGLRLHPD